MKKLLVLVLLLASFFVVSPVFAQSGCCSWHGGVAGCSSSGRKICNDGTLSPSCTCYVAPSTPVIKQYWWGTQSFTDYNSYYRARWDGIQEMYRKYLGRGFNSQEEGKIYANSDKTKSEIESEILASEEHKNWPKLHASAVVRTQTPTPPTDANPDYSWIWWIIIPGGLIAYSAWSERR